MIHLGRDGRMIRRREGFSTRACGVLRKLVNVAGRNLDVIYFLQSERERESTRKRGSAWRAN